jgi:SP family arabinose:H+ symporter-like MFS transporter
MKAREKATLYAYWAAFIAILGGFLQSYVSCAIAGALPFIAQEFDLTPIYEGHLASIILIGALIGSCLSGPPADWFGRRRCLQIAALLFLLTSIGIFFTSSFFSLMLLRLITGLGLGMTAILVPMYLAEISPPATRGAFVTLFQFSVSFGTLVAYLVDYFYESAGNWRAMLGFGASIAAFQLLALFFIPESPKWLFGKGQIEKGNEGLERLQGITLSKHQIPRKEPKSSWASLAKPMFHRVLFIGVLLTVFQQIAGINAIIYFTPKIFGEAGIENAMFSTTLVGIITILATFVSIFLIDRFGRKKLLLLSQLGVALSLLVIIFAFATENAFIDSIAVGAVLAYVATYSLGMGPITWVLVSEIYPLAIRAKAMAVMTFLSWLSNYLVVLTFPSLLSNLGSPLTFSLYFVFGTAAFFLFWRFVPETKGKSLEQIEKELVEK